ncbi:MAG: HD domain-containing phosphohydrolase [Candidatus Omnitrophota bacterium]
MGRSDKTSKTRILIIDDQKLHHLYLQNVLKNAGYDDVRCLAEPLDTFTTVEDYHPDLIILDILMPHMDGFQVMQQLQDFRQEHYLPILAISAETSPEFRLKVLQSGATDFLTKPYENVEILFRIRNMLEMRQLHLALEGQNRILEEVVEERTRELKDSQKEIIQRLAQAAEFRDNETGKHIIRMSYYAERLGRAMGLSDEECELLQIASPLHDIGKIGIPDDILLKPGKLTTEEYKIMKTHALIGGELLAGSRSPVMKMARLITLTHHERWDGTGYPNGLKGDDIPLVGQICSICDIFDALMSKRCYKKAWTPQQAAQEIIKFKGTFFKPELVDAFERILPDLFRIREEYGD